MIPGDWGALGSGNREDESGEQHRSTPETGNDNIGVRLRWCRCACAISSVHSAVTNQSQSQCTSQSSPPPALQRAEIGKDDPGRRSTRYGYRVPCAVSVEFSQVFIIYSHLFLFISRSCLCACVMCYSPSDACLGSGEAQAPRAEPQPQRFPVTYTTPRPPLA